MKSYYIVPRAVLDAHAGRFNGHWLDLDATTVMLCAQFRASTDQDTFEAESSVVALPCLVEARPVGAGIAAKLSAFGVQPGHSAFQAASMLKNHHRGFDPRF